METLTVGLEKRLQCTVCVGERYRVNVLENARACAQDGLGLRGPEDVRGGAAYTVRRRCLRYRGLTSPRCWRNISSEGRLSAKNDDR